MHATRAAEHVVSKISLYPSVLESMAALSGEEKKSLCTCSETLSPLSLLHVFQAQVLPRKQFQGLKQCFR